MRGRYSDGRSAGVRDVEATVQDGAIHIDGGGERIVWRLDSVKRFEGADRSVLVVEPKDGDGARLTVAAADAGALIAAAPRLAPVGASRTIALAVGLTAAAAAIIGFVFFGLPALSGPLARAIPPSTETRLGGQTRAILGYIMEDCVVDAETQAVLDELALRFQTVSGAPFDLEIRLTDASFPNAFALPGGRILVTDDLLDIMETPEELAGVLAHETAHVARRHVMAAMLREMGYGLVLDLTLGGGSGAGQQIALAGASLDSLRHSRRAEAEADVLGLDYLEAADIDGTGLAQFFERLEVYFSAQERRGLEIDFPELMNTHPDTRRRAADARAAAGPSRTPAMSAADWTLIKTGCDSPGSDADKGEPGSDERRGDEPAAAKP